MISARGATAGYPRTATQKIAFLRLALINVGLFSFYGAIAIIA